LTEHDPLPISTAVMVSTAASADFHSTFKTLRSGQSGTDWSPRLLPAECYRDTELIRESASSRDPTDDRRGSGWSCDCPGSVSQTAAARQFGHTPGLRSAAVRTSEFSYL
jgi:hypothetical protein